MQRNVKWRQGACCLALAGLFVLKPAHAAQPTRGLQPGPLQTPAAAAGAAGAAAPATGGPSATTPAGANPGPAQATSGWSLEMGLASPQVVVNQPVQFHVRSSRPVHFTVLGIGADGTAQQLVPRPGSPMQALGAGVAHALPTDYDLRVPTAGTERLYLVASTQPIVAIAPDGKAAVKPTDGGASDATLVVKELQLQVVDPGTAPPVPTPAVPAGSPAAQPGSTQPAPSTPGATGAASVPVASAATAAAAPVLPALVLDVPRRVYRIGETVEVQYGASREGWLHLFLQVGGELEPLGVKGVQAERFQTLRATATAPAGEQALVALWSATEQLDPSARATLERRLRLKSTGSSGASSTRALAVVVDVPIAWRSISLLINP